jgi:dipeptidyl aminopeptidase/acylaminoacyl peptidase
LYLKDKEGDENFQVIIRNLKSDEEIQLTNDSNFYHLNPKFDPSDKRIAVISNRKGKPAQLFLIENDEIDVLTEWNEPIFDFKWISNEEIIYNKGIYENEVRLLNVNGKTDELLLKFERSEIELGDVDLEKKRFLFSTNVNEYFDIAEYDLKERKWSWVYRSNSEKYLPKYLSDGIVFIEFFKGENILRKYDGKIEDIAKGVVEYEIAGNEIAYIKSTSDKPNSLFINNDEVLDNTPEILKNKLIKAKVDSYITFDNRKIETIIYEPKEWNGIAVINIHGGPDGHELDTWDPLSQLLALKGYMVILPNYRGSTGYGKSFLHLNDKDLGGDDMKDILYAREYAKKLGAKKIAVLGVSYGGYLTALCLVKAPEVWDAGVAVAGFYNWFTEYENEADYLKSYDSIKMDKSLFYERSPIFFIENLKAPILLIQGANDPRCPVSEVHQIAEKLSKLGKYYELKIFEDEGHSIRKESNRIEMYKIIIRFLEKTLLT